MARPILLWVILPLIALAYFGSLTVAAWFSAPSYSWRRIAISKLLYPQYDPGFHEVTSVGVAISGLLMLLPASYIRRKLRAGPATLTDAGSAGFALGAIALFLAGFILPPVRGSSGFPRMHEMLARTAAIALGAGMAVLWMSAARTYGARPTHRREWRPLLIAWSLITLPALAIACVRAAAALHFDWPNPLYQRLCAPELWRLGLWEWLGSAAVYLFLLSAVLLVPQFNSHR